MAETDDLRIVSVGLWLWMVSLRYNAGEAIAPSSGYWTVALGVTPDAWTLPQCAKPSAPVLEIC